MSRKILRIMLALATLASLASCVSPQELRAQDEAACASFGFKPGTDAYAGCLQQESLARRYSTPAWAGAPPMYWWSGPGWYPMPLGP